MRLNADHPWTAAVWSLLIGLALVMSKMGLEVLDPFNIQWMAIAGGDLAAHYLGWHYYHLSPLTFPLGTIANYAWPQVTNIGYTDSIPLLAIPFRLLFGWVETPFQYFGWWYLACYSLGVYFSWLILKELGIRSIVTLLTGSILIGLTPFLLFRWGHDALSAQWLILAVYLIYLRNRRRPERTGQSLATLTIVSAFVHPYMTLMVFVLSFPAWMGHWKAGGTSWRIRLFTLGGLLAGIFVSWALIGYFQISSDDAKTIGFGEFSSNLNTFFNPLGHSWLLPTLPLAHPNQYEGFAYLGAGLLLLFFQGLVFHQFRFFPKFRANLGMWFSVGALTLLALTHQWTFGSDYLFKPEFEDRFTGMFRSSGRFIWPAAYALALAAVIGIYRLEVDKRAKYILLILALFLQIGDLESFWQRDQRITTSYLTWPNAPQWDSLLVNVDKVLVHPPFELKTVHPNDFVTLGMLFAPYHIPVSVGYLSRYDDALRQQIYADGTHILETGDFSAHPGALFIVGKNSSHQISRLLIAGKVKVWNLNDYLVVLPMDHVFPVDHPEPFGGRVQQLDLGESIYEFLERNKPNTILLAVHDEASYKLCPEVFDWFVHAKCHIEKLQFRGSWLAIIDQGIIVQESYAMEEPLEWAIPKEAPIGTWTAPVTLRMASGGALNQVIPMLEIDGKDVADRERGIQIAVMDSLGRVIETANYDTYMDCFARTR